MKTFKQTTYQSIKAIRIGFDYKEVRGENSATWGQFKKYTEFEK